jgi:hypothetical protein
MIINDGHYTLGVRIRECLRWRGPAVNVNHRCVLWRPSSWSKNKTNNKQGFPCSGVHRCILLMMFLEVGWVLTISRGGSLKMDRKGRGFEAGLRGACLQLQDQYSSPTGCASDWKPDRCVLRRRRRSISVVDGNRTAVLLSSNPQRSHVSS